MKEVPKTAQQLEHGAIHWDEPLIRKGSQNLLHVRVSCECGATSYIVVSDARRRSRTGYCAPCHHREHFRSLNNQGGAKSTRYKGPTRLNTDGYREVAIYPDDPMYEAARGSATKTRYVRYMLEHRYVMAVHLDRPLYSWEHVHHRDQDKLNNALENLEVVDNETHHTITLLMKENTRLKSEVDRLQSALDSLQRSSAESPQT